MKKLIISCLVFSLFFLTACVDQKIEEDTLRRDIAQVLETYQKGVNTVDEKRLDTIISSQFSFYQEGQATYIRKLLNLTAVIDSISFTNIRVENYKIFADVNMEGTLVYKPELTIPAFKEQMPFLQGTFKKKCIFVFMYEQDGLKILSEETVVATKDFHWGATPPGITITDVPAAHAAPGDTLDVNFNVTKGANNDVVFVYVNNQALGGYNLSGHDSDNEVKYSVTIPRDKPIGSSYDVMLMAFAGKVNLNNPTDAQLQGILIKGYTVQVR